MSALGERIEQRASFPPHISRRNFLWRILGLSLATLNAAVGADALLAHSSTYETPLTWFWELLEGGLLSTPTISDIESEFKITLYQPEKPIAITDGVALTRDFHPAVAQTFKRIALNDSSPKFLPWDAPRLKLFARAMRKLPGGFFQSTRGKTTVALLGSRPRFRGTCICGALPGNDASDVWTPYDYPPVIALVKKDMRALTSDVAHAEELIVHEGTFLRFEEHTVLKNGQYYNPLTEKILATLEVKNIGQFNELNDELVTFFAKGYEKHERVRLATIPWELGPFLGEAYFKGRKEFDNIWGFLGPDKTGLLYQFMKENIFDGMEYDG